jgi:hypothetical protein
MNGSSSTMMYNYNNNNINNNNNNVPSMEYLISQLCQTTGKPPCQQGIAEYVQSYHVFLSEIFEDLLKLVPASLVEKLDMFRSEMTTSSKLGNFVAIELPTPSYVNNLLVQDPGLGPSLKYRVKTIKRKATKDSPNEVMFDVVLFDITNSILFNELFKSSIHVWVAEMQPDTRSGCSNSKKWVTAQQFLAHRGGNEDADGSAHASQTFGMTPPEYEDINVMLINLLRKLTNAFTPSFWGT